MTKFQLLITCISGDVSEVFGMEVKELMLK